MKISLLTFLSIFIICSTGFAQHISQKNWTLVHERSASWCPYCGTWGWNMKEEIFNTFADKNIIFMAVHHSGDLTNTTAGELGNNFSGFGQPIFYMDGVDLLVNSSNIPARINDIKTVLEFKATQPAFAGVGVDVVLDENTKTLSAKAKVEFFASVEGGDYYLGLYLLEDVLNVQTSRPGIPLHKNVLTKSLLPSTFGNALKTGAIAKGTIFNVDATLPNVNAERDKIKVVAIIWNKVGSKYLFFNANIANMVISASTKFESDEENKLVVTQSDRSVSVDLKNIILNQNGFINLADINGRQIAIQKVYKNDSGRIVTLSGDFTPGIHIITLISDTHKISKKIVLH